MTAFFFQHHHRIRLTPARNPHPRNRRRSHLPHPLPSRQNARRRSAAHTRRAEQTAYVGALRAHGEPHDVKADFPDRLSPNVNATPVYPIIPTRPTGRQITMESVCARCKCLVKTTHTDRGAFVLHHATRHSRHNSAESRTLDPTLDGRQDLAWRVVAWFLPLYGRHGKNNTKKIACGFRLQTRGLPT